MRSTKPLLAILLSFLILSSQANAKTVSEDINSSGVQVEVIDNKIVKVNPAINPLLPVSKYYYSENPPVNLYASIDATQPNDPYFYNQWGLYNEGQEFGGLLGTTRGTSGADVNVLPVWKQGLRGQGIKVAVVDTGMNTKHLDFAPRTFPGNKNFLDYSTDVTDTNGHGTMVGGIIGATANNNRGVSGVAPETELYAYKTGEGPGISLEAVADSFQAAGEADIPVINASIGGGYYKPLETAVLNNQDQLYIVAAGNDGRNNDSNGTYPCNLPAENIICVAATDQDDKLAVFSNYGEKSVDLAAPGQDIYSTYFGNSYAIFDGTSAASPFVAGIAALVKQKHPDYTPIQIKQVLLNTVAKKPTLKGVTVSGGRVDAAAAINAPKLIQPKINIRIKASKKAGIYRFGSVALFNLKSDNSSNAFECRIDSQRQWSGCKDKLVIRSGSLEAGKHTLYVRSINKSGLASNEKVIQFSISNKKPSVHITKVSRNKNRITVRIKAQGEKKLSCLLKKRNA